MTAIVVVFSQRPVPRCAMAQMLDFVVRTYSSTCSPPPFTKIVWPLTHSLMGDAK